MNKFIWFAILLAIAACASLSYDQLYDEAMRTGDWDRVEAYERRQERKERMERMAEACRAQGRILYCDNRKLRDYSWRECSCASREEIFGGMRR